jgi:hypothetical protein
MLTHFDVTQTQQRLASAAASVADDAADGAACAQLAQHPQAQPHPKP